MPVVPGVVPDPIPVPVVDEPPGEDVIPAEPGFCVPIPVPGTPGACVPTPGLVTPAGGATPTAPPGAAVPPAPLPAPAASAVVPDSETIINIAI